MIYYVYHSRVDCLTIWGVSSTTKCGLRLSLADQTPQPPLFRQGVTDQSNLKIPFDSSEINIQYYPQNLLRISIVPAVKRDFLHRKSAKAGSHIGLDLRLRISAAASG